MNISLSRQSHPALNHVTNLPVPFSRLSSFNRYLRNLVARSLPGGTTGSVIRLTSVSPVILDFCVIYIFVIGISLGFRVYNLEFRHLVSIRA